MKKICMVAYTNYLSDARPRREAETLARRGDQVDFIALGEGNRPSIEIVQGVRLFRLSQERYRGCRSLSYGLSYLSFACAATLKLIRLFQRERYEIIYVHTMPDILVLVGLIPKLFGATIVLNIHDMMPELYMSKFGIPENHWLIRFLVFQEQFSIRMADRVICVHDPHRDVLCKRGAPKWKITVLPNVPDPLVFGSELSVAKAVTAFRIVYHGTIARRLGVDVAVRAFAKAARHCPDAQFEIYGDGDACDEIDAQIEESGVAERIHFSRKMFRVESIALMIQGASVGIVPNRRDVATEFMLPVKLLEYAHLGIPVIAPRLMTIQYYFGDDQVAYYEPGDVDALADVIRQLYKDEKKRVDLGLKGKAFAKNFCWDSFKERLYRVIDEELTMTSETADGDARPDLTTTSR